MRELFSGKCKKSMSAMLIVSFLMAGFMLVLNPQASEANFNPPRYGYAPTKGKVTSAFGWRSDPMHGKKKFHRGIDIGASMGTPVYSPQPGVIVYSGVYSGYGNVVVVYHGNDVFTLYGHLSQQYVQKGQHVNTGELIAAVGSSGRSTGPHLHFEVHQNKQYVDPMKYLAYVQNWPAMQEAPVRATKHQAMINQLGKQLGNKPQLIQVTQVGKQANITAGKITNGITATVSTPAQVILANPSDGKTGDMINVLATTAAEVSGPNIQKAVKTVQTIQSLKKAGSTHSKVQLLTGTTAELIDFD